jgi:hypothetical protein
LWQSGFVPEQGSEAVVPLEEAHLVALHKAGEHANAELAELFAIGRSTVYRALERAQAGTTA